MELANSYESANSLEERVKGLSRYFETMTNLIPAKYYLPKEEASEGDDWKRRKLKRSEKFQRKHDATNQAKKAKKAKLDPEKNESTTERVKRTLAANGSAHLNINGSKKSTDSKQKKKSEVDQNTVDTAAIHNSATSTELSLDELRARLRAKIEVLRSKRPQHEKPRQKTSGATNAQDKKSRTKGSKKFISSSGVSEKQTSSLTSLKSPGHELERKNISAGTLTEDKGIVFSKFEFGEHVKKKKGEDLRTTLKKVEAKKDKLDRLRIVDQSKTEHLVKKDAWKKAIQLAEGFKVKDDPKLIKKSLKKEEKRKEKSAKQWKERLNVLEEDKQRRQKDRMKNLQDRHEKKKGKKISRAGFEGRLKNK